MDFALAHDDDADGIDKHSASLLRYAEWGLFTIAYVPKPSTHFARLWSFLPSFSQQMHISKSVATLYRLMKDLWQMSKWHCITYLLHEFATVTSPAVAIFSAYQVHLNLHVIGADISAKTTATMITSIHLWIVVWLVWGNLVKTRYKPLLIFRTNMGGHMRLHYMPTLANAVLHAPNDRPKPDMLYGVERFGEYIPGWSAVDELSTHVSRSLEIVFQMVAAFYIASQMQRLEGILIMVLVLLLILSFAYVPTNMVGGAGYTYWTTSDVYKSLMRTHAIVFEDRHRATLTRDGMAENMCQEYTEKMKMLGVVKADTWILSMGLTPHWYWELLDGFVSNSPMALFVLAYLLIGRSISPASIISSMALVQYILFSMSGSVQAAKACVGQVKSGDEILSIIKNLADFYEYLDFGASQWKTAHPEKEDFSKGASLSLRNITLPYPADTNESSSLSAFNVEVKEGQIVGIMADDQGDRRALSELVCGRRTALEGAIFLDGRPLTPFDLTQIRHQIAFGTPQDTVYPLSLKENVLMGLDNSQKSLITLEDLNEAASICELTPVVASRGWDFIPDGATIPGNSAMQAPDKEAWAALDEHFPPPGPAGGGLTETQRFAIILCRVYIRVKHGNTRLVFLEKPQDRPVICDALQGLYRLARAQGKTMVIVANKAGMPSLGDPQVNLDRIIHV